jgi:hypothetical protein
MAEMFNPDSMQSIVDRLKAEGRMPTPEKLDAVIAEARANYQAELAKARRVDRAQGRTRARRSSSRKTS